MESLRVDDFFPITLLDSIFIRPLRQQHAKALFHGVDKSRASLSKFLPWVSGTTTVDHSSQFIEFAIEQEKIGAGLHCGIFKRDGQLEEDIIGCVGLNKINVQTKTTQLGYWLLEDQTGAGLCTLACRKMIDYAQAIGITQFEIHAHRENTKSQGVAERLGFHRVPDVFKDGADANNIPIIDSQIVFVLQTAEPATFI